jgi:hypothetical protein
MNEKDQQSIGSGEITPTSSEWLRENEVALVKGMIESIWNWPKKAIIWFKTILELENSDLWPLKDMWWKLVNSKKYENQIQVKDEKDYFFISSNLDARFTSVLSKNPEIIATCSGGIVTLDFADKHNESNKNCWKFITWKSDSGEIDSEMYDIAEKILKQWFSWKLNPVDHDCYKVGGKLFDSDWSILETTDSYGLDRLIPVEKEEDKIDPKTLRFLSDISKGLKPGWDEEDILV